MNTNETHETHFPSLSFARGGLAIGSFALVGFVMGVVLASPISIQIAVSQEAPTEVTEVDPPQPEPTSDEPTSDEPTSDEPTSDEPTSDEPTSDEPTSDEPTSDEPTSDEPTQEDASQETSSPATVPEEQPAPSSASPEAPAPVDATNTSANEGSIQEIAEIHEDAGMLDDMEFPTSEPIATDPQEIDEDLPPRELSVAPSTTDIVPDDRPAWVTMEPDLSKDTHRLVVSSTTVASKDELELALDLGLIQAVDRYLMENLGDAHVLSGDIGLSPDTMRRMFVTDPEGYVMTLQTDPPMYKKYVMLEISKAQRDKIETLRREAVQRSRLFPLGLGVVSVLGVLGLSHLVFKRKNVLPSSQPLEAPHIVATREMEGARKSAGNSALGWLGFFFVVGGLMFVFMALPALFLIAAPRIEKVRMVETASPSVSIQIPPEFPIELPTPPSPPQVSELEYRIQKGNQTIIVRER